MLGLDAGKVFLVTGGAGGIGSAMATVLADFLFSDLASGITGAVLNVDGGYSAR